MSSSQRLLVELSPHSLQAAVLTGDRLDVCHEFPLDAKEALTAFAAEHSGTPVARALLSPRSGFARLSDDSEATGIRTIEALLAHAAKLGSSLDGTITAVACDAATGKLPEPGKSSKWLLAGTTADGLDQAKQQLVDLGISAGAATLALPCKLGAAVSLLSATPGTRVAVIELRESESNLWLVSSAGVEKATVVPLGFNQVFDAVQAELGLKFRTAAAKLFLSNTYDFSDLAAGIAGRLKDPLATAIKALGESPSALWTLGLSAHQNWFGKALAQAVGLKVWLPDMAAACKQFELNGPAATAELSPTLLGLLKAAAASNKAGNAWLPAWLDSASSQPTPVTAASESAPAKAAEQEQAPTAQKTPVQDAPVAKTAPASVAPTRPKPTKPGPKTVSSPTRPIATVPVVEPAPKKSRAVPIVIATVVVAGLAAVGMKLSKGDDQAAGNAAAEKLPVIPPSTVAYYRFENGPADGALSTQPSDVVADSSPNGYGLMVYGFPFYDPNVPAEKIGGAPNKFCAHFKEPSNLSNIAVQSLNSVVFKDFTIETFVKFDSLGNTQTIIGRDIDPRSNTENLGPFALFYLSKGSSKPNPKNPDYVPNSFQLQLTTDQKQQVQIVSPVAAKVNNWYHLAVVGDTTKQTLTLYINGTQVGQVTGFQGMLAPKSNSSWTFGRGQYDKKSGDWLQGSMDEIRFSNVALTPDKFLDSELRPK